MIKNYPIEFVKQIIVQQLFRNKGNDPTLIGGDDQVNLMSFFEQVKTQEEVDRYVQKWQSLVDQENRDTHIVNGIISTQENPTITNLYNCLIIPMTWNCILRCKLKDMDMVVNSVSKLIESLKGRKQDIAEYDDGSLYMVGTIGNYSDNRLEAYDCIGLISKLTNETEENVKTKITNRDNALYNTYGFLSKSNTPYTMIFANNYLVGTELHTDYKIKVFERINDQIVIIDNGDDLAKGLDMPKDIYLARYTVSNQESYSDNLYKVSMSCDAIRVDTPQTINGEEYVNVSFSGSATIVNNSIRLGNDLVHIGIKRHKLITDTTISYDSETYTYLEPLEMPSGNNISNQLNQLASNNFKNNHHNDSISPTLQYTFVCDNRYKLLRDLYKYGRYGTFDYMYGISPNMIYKVKEVFSNWGEVEVNEYIAKIVEDINIENNEADVLTLQLTFAVQGENN